MEQQPVGFSWDLCVAWNWEHDQCFVDMLRRAAVARGLSLGEAVPATVSSVVGQLGSGVGRFSALLDRASDGDPAFLPLVDWALRHGCLQINRHERAVRCRNKAAMHLEFITAGLRTPYTFLLPSYEEQPLLGEVDFSLLGDRFIVKPAHGGGGEGVVRHARTKEDVERARRTFPWDSYLVQAWVVPIALEGRPAWFRVLYCLGEVFPCWWDPRTHRYEVVGEGEQERYGLRRLRDTAQTIAWVAGLDLFSSEMALVEDGSLVVVDYVNDPVDLRLQSVADDGVPDHIVARIAELIAQYVATSLRPQEG